MLDFPREINLCEADVIMDAFVDRSNQAGDLICALERYANLDSSILKTFTREEIGATLRDLPEKGHSVVTMYSDIFSEHVNDMHRLEEAVETTFQSVMDVSPAASNVSRIPFNSTTMGKAIVAGSTIAGGYIGHKLAEDESALVHVAAIAAGAGAGYLVSSFITSLF